MGLTKGTRIIKAAMQRESRLSKSKRITSPHGYKIMNEDSAMALLKGYSAGTLKKSDIDTVMSVLEDIEEKGSGKYIATYIANELAIGMVPESSIDKYSNVSEESRDIIESALSKNDTYDRILKNQAILEKRYNINKTCKEKRFVKPVVESLCQLIDTYDIPLSYKFNIALENSLFSLVKNNIIFESDMQVANIVTKYFMTRDAVIYDKTYKSYQSLLKESEVFDVSNPTGMVKIVLENDGNYFANKVMAVMKDSTDPKIREFGELFNSTVTEADVVTYINTTYDYYANNDLSPLDVSRLHYSINMLPSHTGISPDFINTKYSDVYGYIDTDSLFDPDFNRDNNNIFDSTPSIRSIIAETEAAQDKDEELVMKFVNQLSSKPEKSLFGEIVGIIKCIKTILLLVAAAKTAKVIFKVCKILFKFISKLYGLTSNFGQVKSLNDNLSSLTTISQSLNPGEQRDAVMSFEKDLKRLIEKNSDTSVIEDTDIFNDMTDEEAIIYCSSLIEAGYDLMTKRIEKNSLQNMVEVCAKNKCVDSLYEVYKYSSNPEFMFTEAYNNIFDKRTMRPLSNIKMESKSDIENLLCMIEANNTLASLDCQLQTVNESVLNTIKLALHNAKDKIKKFDVKQKEMWRTLDAYANKFMTSIEDSRDNDRRNAIIQGKTIPSFSKCVKTAIALAGAGVVTANVMVPIIGAMALLARSNHLDNKEKQQLMDEIEIELKALDKEIELADKEDDLDKYRKLLRMQKKLQHEYQRIRYKRKTFKVNVGDRRK